MAMRNKPMGFARIIAKSALKGLDGRIVQTTVHDGNGYWYINPPQEVVATASLVLGPRGKLVLAGESVTIKRVHDRRLEPIKDVPDDAVDETLLWLPVPVPETA